MIGACREWCAEPTLDAEILREDVTAPLQLKLGGMVNALADAILDCLMHNAQRLPLKRRVDAKNTRPVY
jgi:hypothetical protein